MEIKLLNDDRREFKDYENKKSINKMMVMRHSYLGKQNIGRYGPGGE